MNNYGSAYANELVDHITVPCKRTNEFMHLRIRDEQMAYEAAQGMAYAQD